MKISSDNHTLSRLRCFCEIDSDFSEVYEFQIYQVRENLQKNKNASNKIALIILCYSSRIS